MKNTSKYTFWSELSPIDRITLFYLLLSGMYIVIGASRVEHVLLHMVARLCVFGLIAGLIFLEKKSQEKQVKKMIDLARNIYQIFLFSFFYAETNYMKNIIFTHDLDFYVASFEYTLFGFQPSFAFSARFNQEWFREIMSACYFSFYAFVPFFCLFIFFHKRQIADKVIFIITFSFYMFYLLYDIIPVLGPQYYFNTIASDGMPPYFFGEIRHYILLNIEKPTGAFPSSHVGLAFITCLLAYRYHKKSFYIILPFSIGICFATVYLKEHYLVDVLVALLVAPLFMYISSLVYNRLLLLNTPQKEKASNIGRKAYFCHKF